MQDYNDAKRLKLPDIEKYKAFTDDTKGHIEEMKHGSNNILVFIIFPLKNFFELKNYSFFINIKVAVRVRPLNSKELTVSDFDTVRILDQKLVILLDPGNEFEPEDVIFLIFYK